MIHYQLRCGEAHEFDGWFKDSAAFDRLAGARLVQCPVCGGTEVSRALMAPAIGRKGRVEAAATEGQPAPAAPPGGNASVPPGGNAPVPAGGGAPMTAGPLPAQVRAMLQRLRAEVERNCDYVGKEFADEARRMARGESDRRGIYGEASEADAEALHDEGIEIARIPWVPPADS
ncbi:DUF1178 family protein [Roseomonas sp. NAR14]|uniref:DUF1178 family protein n=1 Tax=Roseomonas acroporae TaxID=2937791 RepID=A0A9X1YBH2_9PROT|nr:DUF1178 family protein [Roseomonas acroporae]MCK8786655.1 DUF1178 family protein [Roseomonas acroporae]